MKRRMVGSAVFAVGAALFVAGCGTGQITQTSSQVAAINGARAEVGDLAIRNAAVAYHPGGGKGDVYRRGSDAGVEMWVVNQTMRADRLVSVDSAAASNVTVEGSRQIPAQGTLVLTRGDPRAPRETQTSGTLTLRGLSTQLRAGEQIELTLTFRNAGRLRFELPVTVPSEPRPEDSESHGGGH